MKWDTMKTALAMPWWYITKDCEKLIETLPNLVRDENNPDDIEESDYDHWAEAAGHAIVHVNRKKDKRLKTDGYFREKLQPAYSEKNWMLW
jgi:hypothetical protein